MQLPAIAPLFFVVALASTNALARAQTDASEARKAWTQEKLEAATERIRGEIEAIRGERFLRPIQVELTDAEGFVRYMTARIERHVSKEELRNEEAIAKLLGLVPADMDMWQTTFDVLEDQVGGFYDPGADAFYLMDSFAGPVAEIILAHELTHALDDQLFDIDGTMRELLDQSDAASAFHAVVEGSGTSLMALWAQQYGGELSMEDLDAAMDVGADALAGAPTYLWKPLFHSYKGGLQFLDRGYKQRKREGKDLSAVVREAFEHPPLSTEQVLHPDKYWKRDAWDAPRGIAHEVGLLPDGWSVAEERVLGELVLAILVDEGSGAKPLDLTNALAVALLEYTNDAAAGWGGDAVLLLAKGDAWLAHGMTLWDSEDDAQEFRAVLEAYAPEWERRVAALDVREAGHGSRLLPPARADGVRFAVWAGVSSEEAARVIDALAFRELPAAKPSEMTGEER